MDVFAGNTIIIIRAVSQVRPIGLLYVLDHAVAFGHRAGSYATFPNGIGPYLSTDSAGNVFRMTAWSLNADGPTCPNRCRRVAPLGRR
jgi:hypothetical protein